MAANRSKRATWIPHCVYCRADSTQTQLVTDRNGITGAVTMWCASIAECRGRKEAQRDAG